MAFWIQWIRNKDGSDVLLSLRANNTQLWGNVTAPSVACFHLESSANHALFCVRNLTWKISEHWIDFMTTQCLTESVTKPYSRNKYFRWYLFLNEFKHRETDFRICYDAFHRFLPDKDLHNYLHPPPRITRHCIFANNNLCHSRNWVTLYYWHTKSKNNLRLQRADSEPELYWRLFNIRGAFKL